MSKTLKAEVWIEDRSVRFLSLQDPCKGLQQKRWKTILNYVLRQLTKCICSIMRLMTWRVTVFEKIASNIVNLGVK